MIKKDLPEVKANVQSRLKYFDAELGRIETQQKELEAKQEKHRQAAMELQKVANMMQQAAVQQQLKK